MSGPITPEQLALVSLVTDLQSAVEAQEGIVENIVESVSRAEQALGDVATIGANAIAAQGAELSTRLSEARYFPPDFIDGSKWWTGGQGQTGSPVQATNYPLGGTFVTVAGVGVVYQTEANPPTLNSFGTVGVVAGVTDTDIRIEVRARALTNNTGPAAHTGVGLINIGADFTGAAFHVGANFPSLTVADGWQTLVWDFVVPATNDPNFAAYYRPAFFYNAVGDTPDPLAGSTDPQGNQRFQIAFFLVTEISVPIVTAAAISAAASAASAAESLQSSVNSLASATASAGSATAAATSATNAAVSAFSYALRSQLPITGIAAHQSATIWGDTDANNGSWEWSGTAWARTGDTPAQAVAKAVAVVTDKFAPDYPIGSELQPGTQVVVNLDDWIVLTLTPTAAGTLTLYSQWIADLANSIQIEPSGGDFYVRNLDDWIIYNFSAPLPTASSSGATFVPTITDGQVAAVLTTQVEDQPLLGGVNIILSAGESSAHGLDYMSEAFDQLCIQHGTPKPAGATVNDINDFHNAYTVDENIALRWHHDNSDDTPGTTENIDAGFTSFGAECITAILMNEMGNDMVAFNTPDYWEKRVLNWIKMIQNYSKQKYKGTVPGAIMPTPPCFMTLFHTWPNGNLNPAIPLRAIEMARRIYGFGISTTESVATFYDDRHYGTPGDILDLDGMTRERRRIASHGGIAVYHWRINKRKFHPTQVIGAWADGTSAFLEFYTPVPPLQVNTTLVAAIANNGLEAFTAAGARITITGVSILPNGRTVQVTQAAPWVVGAAGDQIWGAMTPTTPGTAGRLTGARSPFCDSATHMIDLGMGAGPEPFQSYMLPFMLTLTQGVM